jgi:hypothetical protein
MRQEHIRVRSNRPADLATGSALLDTTLPNENSQSASQQRGFCEALSCAERGVRAGSQRTCLRLKEI